MSPVAPVGLEQVFIAGVKRESSPAREKIFGPMLSVLVVDSVDEGVELCNDTRYGPGACLFIRHLRIAELFGQRVEAGMIHVGHGTASQAHVPFGGVKESGFGARSIGSTAKDFSMNGKRSTPSRLFPAGAAIHEGPTHGSLAR